MVSCGERVPTPPNPNFEKIYFPQPPGHQEERTNVKSHVEPNFTLR